MGFRHRWTSSPETDSPVTSGNIPTALGSEATALSDNLASFCRASHGDHKTRLFCVVINTTIKTAMALSIPLDKKLTSSDTGASPTGVPHHSRWTEYCFSQKLTSFSKNLTSSVQPRKPLFPIYPHTSSTTSLETARTATRTTVTIYPLLPFQDPLQVKLRSSIDMPCPISGPSYRETHSCLPVQRVYISSYRTTLLKSRVNWRPRRNI